MRGRTRAFAIALTCAVCATPVAAERDAAAGTALCQGIAAQLRANRDVVSGAVSPIAALTKGPAPYIVMATRTDGVDPQDDGGAFLAKIRKDFQLTPQVAAKLKGALFDFDQVSSLKGTELHVLVDTGGSASCESFTFFDRRHVFPDTPTAREEPNALCWNDGGDIARVDGTVAFLETVLPTTGTSYEFIATPWRDGNWGPACHVAVDFQPRYRLSQSYLPNGGAVSKDTWDAAAPAIAESWDRTDAGKGFHYGAAVADADKAMAARMVALAPPDDNVTVPSFGIPHAKLAPYYEDLDHSGVSPVVLDGRTWLLRIGHATIGWRDYADLVLILYALNGDTLEPVASAVVDKSDGPLASVTVRAGKTNP
jgi:hypothetical protein